MEARMLILERGEEGWYPVEIEAEHFVGRVTVEQATEAPAAGMRVTRVQFEPGAVTHWHSHPLGQVLVIVSGRGRIGTREVAEESLNPGDVVVCRPLERHWHGAVEDEALVHLSITPETRSWWGDRVEHRG
jgi:quercetin dioxygenase-like cupin family protein